MMEYMTGFNHEHAAIELEEYIQPYFDNIIRLYEDFPKEYATAFFNYMFPISEDFDTLIEKCQKSLQLAKSDTLIQNLKEKIDMLKRRKIVHKAF